MNKFLKNLAIVASLGFSASVVADPITISDTDAGTDNGTNVGSIDTILDWTSGNGGLNAAGDCGQNGGQSNEAKEECWAENVLLAETGAEVDLEFTVRGDPVDKYATSQAGVFAFPLLSGPGYYIIKNATTWVLLENLVSVDWGVLDVGLLPDGFGNLGNDDTTISHLTEFNGGGDDMEVPEPGTLGLLGLGLLGLGFARRWRESA